MENLGHKDQQVPQDPLDKEESPDVQAQLAQQVHEVKQGKEENLAQQASQEIQVPGVRGALLDLPVLLVRQDLQGPWDRQETQVQEVKLDRGVNPEHKDQQVFPFSGTILECLVPKFKD